jgi:hypothetical protein
MFSTKSSTEGIEVTGIFLKTFFSSEEGNGSSGFYSNVLGDLRVS